MPSSVGIEAAPKVVGILQPGYLPWLGFFEQLNRVDIFVLYDDVEYSRGTWRNRNRIKTASGPLWLTVPVRLKGRSSAAIDTIEICQDRSWQRKHVDSVRQAYSRAPYFGRYIDAFAALLERPWRYLAELDRVLIVWLAQCLGIDTPIVSSRSLGVVGDRIDRLVAIVKHFGGTCFYEGAAGRDYIDPESFRRHGIEVVFQDYRHPVYPQLHGEFFSHLSVVDLLFNCGPGSLDVITGVQR